ncbi:MAG: CinA family protein [Rickettsiales bacterium]
MLRLKYYAYLLSRKLKRKKLTIALAESCTGGMLAANLTAFNGASNYFNSALIVYSNKAKINLLHIDKNTLKKYGAVSDIIALEMSKNLYKMQKTNITIAITGIAGPKSDNSNKAVGLVYIALTTKDTNLVKEYNFSGKRTKIRKLSSLAAIKLIAEHI